MATKKVTRATASTDNTGEAKSGWKPTPEAKSKATGLRLGAFGLWLAAIGGEAFVIFWLLKRTYLSQFMLFLIGAIVIIGALALVGNLLWKKSNLLDPPSRSNPLGFTIQTQLGVVMTLIAFVPMIVLIFLNKDMDGKQKGIAGAVAIALALVVGYFGFDQTRLSTEQMDYETNLVVEATGVDLVCWTPQGKVYHLCPTGFTGAEQSIDVAAYPDIDSHLTRDCKTEQCGIVSGTVAAAHQAGKERLCADGTAAAEAIIKAKGGTIPDAPAQLPADDEASPTPEPTTSEPS